MPWQLFNGCVCRPYPQKNLAEQLFMTTAFVRTLTVLRRIPERLLD